jgi:uncharacterized membrane protein HdeD (DUF308 family)
MLQFMSRYWWRVMLRGVAAILFGLAALVWLGVTCLNLVVLFGCYALADGVITLSVAASRTPSSGGGGWFLAEGVIGVATGIVTFIWPAATGLALLWLIAGWALALGMLKVAAAVRLRHAIRGAWLLALSGAVSLAFGGLLATRPAGGALALLVVIAVSAPVIGVAMIGLGLHLHRFRTMPPSLDVDEAALP